jgi:peptidoglycan/xylan/chitin deacetylase (PgdA/CDA1 family)
LPLHPLQNIPVLAYHKISSEKEFGITTVSPQRFSQQMGWLHQNGYRTITFKQLETDQVLPEKPVILTFDDAFSCVYHEAFPVMTKYGFTGVLFVVTDFIGNYALWEPLKVQQKYRHLNERELHELQNNGFEIASHSCGHPFIVDLSEAELSDELRRSAQDLKAQFKSDIHSFCFPYGRYNRRVVDAALDAGYRYLTGNVSFTNTFPEIIARRSVYQTDSMRSFRKKLRVPVKRMSGGMVMEKMIQTGGLASIYTRKLQNI